jgi:shikimate dehydrogenase
MIKAAVLGSPIGHSLSPLLHRRAYEILGAAASYEAIDLKPEGALAFFETAFEEGWTGFSLTMPLKESIIEVAAVLGFEIDSPAMRAASGNTVLRRENNFYVTSTDRTGFIRMLESVKKDRVAIIGGGGTARAALSALDANSGSIDFLLRTSGRRVALEQIAEKSELHFFGMDHSLEGYDLVISTVPAGVSDEIASGISYRIPTFFEVLYNPYPTALLARCAEFGSETFDGIDLLVEQALDQIALFSARNFDYSMMRSALTATARERLR